MLMLAHTYDLDKYWDNKSMWFAIYNGNQNNAEYFINKRPNLIFEDQMFIVFMKAYLQYRIEIKRNKSDSINAKKLFVEADKMVDCYLTLD